MRLLPASAALLLLCGAFAQVEDRRPTRLPGDNGPATKAEINDPQAIAVDGSKALYIVEEGGIRRVNLKTGVITTVQTKTRLEVINSLAVDTNGNLIAGEFTVDRVRRSREATMRD